MNEGDEIRFIDLFSGIGGFRLGLENVEGFRCVWSCDNNKYANQVYTKQFGEANHHPGDIRGVDPEDIPDFDLLCAGFPCQSFSNIGRRKGFKDPRGTLFYEIWRITESKRSTLLLLENVKGLLSHDKCRTFSIIHQGLEELGYWKEWQVLNSKYFGVPQHRERVFIIGHHGEKSWGEIFPIRETNEMALKGSPGQREYISTAIDANYFKGPDKHGQRTMIKVGDRIRRLTPVECERLQGFPDGWTEGISDTQRYRALGNAVTTNVVTFLGKRIMEAEK